MSSSLENTSIFLVCIATDASIPDLRQKEEEFVEVNLLTKHFSKKQHYLLLNIKKSLESSILQCNNQC